MAGLRGVMVACGLAVLATPLAAADSWLCLPSLSTGFKLDRSTKSWARTDFLPNSRYLIRELKAEEYVTTFEKAETEAVPYGVFRMGDDDWMYMCERPFERGNDNLFCDAVGEFKFNRKTLRYLMTYTVAYFIPEEIDTYPLTPVIEIGTCSPL